MPPQVLSSDEYFRQLIVHYQERGAFVDVVDLATADGARVAVVGYGQVRDDAEFGFDRCSEELDVLVERWTLLAQEREEVIFVDLRTVIVADERALYDEDRVHPSVMGSEVAGEALAEAIQGVSVPE